jgi:hypothetical protein
MTARNVPTVVTHFTHVDNLPMLMQHGLFSDTAGRAFHVLAV